MSKTDQTTAYHGSLDDSIKAFKPLSHFGCRDAALAAAAAKYFHPDNLVVKTSAFLYTVRLKLVSSFVLDGIDFGGPSPRALLSHLPEMLSQYPLLAGEASAASLRILRESGERSAGQNDALHVALGLLSKIGKQVIRYPNKCESAGEYSFAVIDPSLVEIVGSPDVISMDDLERGFYFLQYGRSVAELIHPNDWGKPNPEPRTYFKYSEASYLTDRASFFARTKNQS